MPETVRNYFGAITDVVQTFWQGLSVTLSHLLRRPITIQYPDRTEQRVADMLPARYRGFLEVDLAVCTGCLACKRACPNDCIRGTLREIHLIDQSKCIKCGACQEACRFEAIEAHRDLAIVVQEEAR